MVHLPINQRLKMYKPNFRHIKNIIVKEPEDGTTIQESPFNIGDPAKVDAPVEALNEDRSIMSLTDDDVATVLLSDGTSTNSSAIMYTANAGAAYGGSNRSFTISTQYTYVDFYVYDVKKTCLLF